MIRDGGLPMPMVGFALILRAAPRALCPHPYADYVFPKQLFPTQPRP